MTTQISSITLDHDLIWTDEYTAPTAAGSSARTVDGHLVMQSSGIVSGRPLTLRGGADHGWLTKATLDLLRSLSATPGVTFTTTLPDTRSFTTMFDHANHPVIEFIPVALATKPGSSFYFYGTIKLVIID
jgi:hypothetical protein